MPETDLTQGQPPVSAEELDAISRELLDRIAGKLVAEREDAREFVRSRGTLVLRRAEMDALAGLLAVSSPLLAEVRRLRGELAWLTVQRFGETWPARLQYANEEGLPDHNHAPSGYVPTYGELRRIAASLASDQASVSVPERERETDPSQEEVAAALELTRAIMEQDELWRYSHKAEVYDDFMAALRASEDRVRAATTVARRLFCSAPLTPAAAPHPHIQDQSLSGPHPEEPDDLAFWTRAAEDAR